MPGYPSGRSVTVGLFYWMTYLAYLFLVAGVHFLVSSRLDLTNYLWAICSDKTEDGPLCVYFLLLLQNEKDCLYNIMVSELYLQVLVKQVRMLKLSCCHPYPCQNGNKQMII
jgi:hypothetical protein